MKSPTPGHFKNSVQVVSLFLVAWVVIVPVGSLSSRSHRVKNQPAIRVRIYNYAHIHKLDLHDAERHAAYLFARAGVRIAWTVQSQKQRAGRPQPEDSDADFFIRILPLSMAARCNHKSGALGQSLIPSGVYGPTPGGIADIFYESVKKLSSQSGSFFGEVLGDAMAHELGHLLLGSEHSPGGIMRAHWTRGDLKLSRLARLQFLPEQEELLQRAARQLQKSPSLTVTAQR